MMIRPIRNALTIGILVLGLGNAGSGVAIAGQFEDGVAAQQSGDYATALKIFRTLAEQGDAIAQSSLGFMYAEGQGVAKDDKEAVKWFRLAAEQGYAKAQYGLGLMYVTGRGVATDNVRAYMWFNLAAANGYADAVKYRDNLATFVTPAQIAQAQEMATKCKGVKLQKLRLRNGHRLSVARDTPSPSGRIISIGCNVAIVAWQICLGTQRMVGSARTSIFDRNSAKIADSRGSKVLWMKRKDIDSTDDD